MADEKKIKKLKRLMSLEQDPTATVFNELERIDSTIEDIKSQVDNIQLQKGDPGEPGKDGTDYVLTEDDKQQIASSIKVPVVEKVIEKTTEVIKEPTVVQNITQVIDKSTIIQDSAQKVLETIVIPEETGETIVNKINDLPTNDQALKIDAKHIKNLPTAIQQFGGVTPQKVLDLIAENPSASTFLDLTDTPDSYTGQAAKVVKVKVDETGLEFGVATDTDEKVKLSASDPTAGYLDAKLNEGVTGVKASGSAGFHIHNASGQDVALFGLGGGQNSTFYDGVKLDASTASRILSTDASKNITALDTATYPDLTELSYVKGVTSAIQTQLNTAKTGSMTFIIGDGLAAITAGTIGYLPQIPFGGTITGWYITETSSTPVAGSIVIDVWKDTTGNYPPTIADSIAGSEKPTLSSATNNKDETLTSFTTAISAGDCLGFKVDSNTGCKKVILIIKFNKS